MTANSWEDASDLCAAFGLQLDPWQDTVLRVSLGERRDGSWAAKQVGVSAPRQNGKSQMIVARALAGALLFGEKKIIISAHQQDTARETFTKFTELVEENPALEDRVSKVMNAFNRESITFTNGAHIQFKARSTAGGRGFSSDCLLLDEAQILGMPAWRSINSTMSARPNPQVWLLGTPPTPEDNGEVFTAIRRSAHGGEAETLAWLEWCADPDDDPALISTRRKANPAWDTRINHEVVQGEYETYTPDDFALERLGIWASDRKRLGAIDLDLWQRAVSTAESPVGVEAVGVAVSVDQSWASLGAVSIDHDRPLLGAVQRKRGTAWLFDEVLRLWREHHTPVVIDAKGPAGFLIEPLREAGVDVVVAGTDDVIHACAQLVQLLEENGLGHADHEDLNDAVLVATWRSIGERRAFGRRRGDISMLEAVTLALWVAVLRSRESIYEDRGMRSL